MSKSLKCGTESDTCNQHLHVNIIPFGQINQQQMASFLGHQGMVVRQSGHVVPGNQQHRKNR